MTPPLVSCIVPVWNGERHLRETLASILAQTHPAVELVVADDGSTDGTPAIVEELGPLARYVRQENAGHAAARNLGLRAAQGAFVSFLDADDLWHPEKLARQLRLLERRPELGGCVTLVQNFWSPDAVPDESHGEPLHPVPGYRSVTLLARREAFDAVGPFDPRLRHGNDTDWFLRAEDRGVRIALLPEILVRRRLHAGNRSRLLAAASRREYVHIVKASLDRRRPAAAAEGS